MKIEMNTDEQKATCTTTPPNPDNNQHQHQHQHQHQSTNELNINNTSNSNSNTSNNKNLKRKRIATELERLTRDENRIAKSKSAVAANGAAGVTDHKPASIQLYASDFDNVSVAAAAAAAATSDGCRPKRRIKTVVRYADIRRTYAQQMQMSALAGKCGSGFLCPQCHTHLSYDEKQCWHCGVCCEYVPGIGVVVSKDRNEVSQLEGIQVQVNDIFDVRVEPGFGSTSTSTSTRSSSSRTNNGKQTKKKTKTKTKKVQRNKQVQVQEKAKLLTQPTVSVSVSVSISIDNLSKQKAEAMLLNAETKECEACLQLFLPSYLQRHRRRCHSLGPDMFACPYCKDMVPFRTMKDRHVHISKFHAGQPFQVSDEKKSRTKLYLYNCPKCDVAMTYGDLRDHVHVSHDGDDIRLLLHNVTCTCPFCLRGSQPEQRTFMTTDALLLHVKKNHKGCSVIGKKLKLDGADTAITTRAIGADDEDDEDDHDHDQNEECEQEEFEPTSSAASANTSSSAEDFYWYALSADISIQQSNVKGIACKPGQSADSILEMIDAKLERYEEQLGSKKEGKKDDDYLAENRLYIRGIRDRTNKAEGEALEKAAYKDKCEENQRWLDYQSRTKKKSPEQVEFEELLYRPFHFERASGATVGTRRDKCSFGDNCELCNGSYATWIVTEKEVAEGGGNVAQAVNLLRSTMDRKAIPSRSFRKVTDDDLPDDIDLDSKPAASARRVRTRRNDDTELWKLKELKHTVEFIKEFNRGPPNSR